EQLFRIRSRIVTESRPERIGTAYRSALGFERTLASLKATLPGRLCISCRHHSPHRWGSTWRIARQCNTGILQPRCIACLGSPYHRDGAARGGGADLIGLTGRRATHLLVRRPRGGLPA